MLTPNPDGSLKYSPRRPKFQKHEAYEMMEAMEAKRGNYKRRR